MSDDSFDQNVKMWDGSTEISDSSSIPSAVFDSLSHITKESSVDLEEGGRMLMGKDSAINKYHRKHSLEIDPDLKHSDLVWCPPSDSTSLTKKGYPVSPDKDGIAASKPDIVWPPMIILMYNVSCPFTGTMWFGEHLAYCNLSNAVKVFTSNSGLIRNQGRSVLIFESSVKGYLECVDLHARFVEEGRDKFAWEYGRAASNINKVHGYMATGTEMYIFNEDLPDKEKLAFDLKSLEDVTWRSPAGSISKEEHQLLIDQQQQLSNARIKLIHSKLSIEERVFKDKFMNWKKSEVFGKYEAERARLVQGLELRKSVLEQQHQQQEMDQKQLHLDALVDMDKFMYTSKKTEVLEKYEAERAQLVQEHQQQEMDQKQLHLDALVDMEQDFAYAVRNLIARSPSPHSA